MTHRARLALLFALITATAPLLPPLTGHAQAQEAGPVVVELGSELGYLDEAELRRSIGAELHTEAIRGGPGAAQARGTILLGLDRASGELLMTYRPRAGSPLMRKIKLPAERSDQVTTIALLAGNLARDEASELLAGLAPKAPASASAATPEPAPAASASAPAAEPTDAAPAKPGACAVRRERWTPVAVQAVPGVGWPLSVDNFHTTFALSFVGLVGEVRDGAHLGALVAGSSGDVRGASVGGMGSVAWGELHGASLGGLAHVGGCDLYGVGAGGLGAWQRGNARGAVVGGLASFVGGTTRGLQLAGLASYGGGVEGLSLAGLGSYQHGAVYGAQVAGLVSASDGKVTGLQLAGLLNMALGGVEGVQLSTVNIAGDVHGGQVGVVNFAGRVKGTQIGLVNLADHMEGLPLGLFSLAGNTRLQGVLWASPRPQVNLGLKMTTGYAYQMVSASFHRDGGRRGDAPKTEDDAPLYGLGYTLGVHIPFESLFLDADLGHHWLFPDLHLSSKGNDLRWGSPHESWLKARVLVGAQVWGRLEVFGGGGVRVQANADAPAVQPEWSAGVNF